MTALTASYGLVFPTADDAPCDVAEQMAGNAQLIEDALLGMGSLRDRFWPAIPAAAVSCPPIAASNPPDGSYAMSIQAELFDTDGLVDSDRDPDAMEISRAGVWVTDVTGLTNSSASSFQQTFGLTSDLGVGDASTPELGSFSTAEVAPDTIWSLASLVFEQWTSTCPEVYAGGERRGAVYGTFGANAAQTIFNGWFSAVWLRDAF